MKKIYQQQNIIHKLIYFKGECEFSIPSYSVNVLLDF